MTRSLILFLLATLATDQLRAESPDSPVHSEGIAVVQKTAGLVAFWTFAEKAGEPRVSLGTVEKHALLEVGGPVPQVAGGPFSGSSAELDGRRYFRVPRASIGNLDIHGKEAQVSMFAVVRVDNMTRGVTVAGIWSEGKGANDDSGTRQYSLLLNMPAYGGGKQLTPHVSAEGGVTRRADGSGFPWCADYAATVSQIPLGKWVTIGMTYDSKYLTAYINGVMEKRPLNPEKDRRNDPYFTEQGLNGGRREMNPYYHGRGIFQYDPAKHAESKPDGAADFTVGACYAVGHQVGNPLIGRIGGLAVFNRALSAEEMWKLHKAANLTGLPEL